MIKGLVPRYFPGDRVRILRGGVDGYTRTPEYIQGCIGRVVLMHGKFSNPESMAYGHDGLPKQFLYMIKFNQSAVWGDRYVGLPDDSLYVDIFEHWLELT